MLPTFRPDRAMAVESPAAFNAWVDRLAERSGIDVGTISTAFSMPCGSGTTFFHSRRLPAVRPRHGNVLCGRLHAGGSRRHVSAACEAAKPLSPDEALKFKSAMLYELAVDERREGLGPAVPLRGHAEQQQRGCCRRSGRTRASTRSAIRGGPARWRGSSTASIATAGWPRRSSTTSIRPTMRSWPR